MSLQILVVDDQQINRTILSRSLEKEGYTVITAANGLEALEAFTHNDPDIVLLDAMMPVMDGFVAAPKLKKMSTNVYLPIIFLTALDDQESLKRCLEVGGDDFLSKPFDQVILAAKIKAHARIRELSKKTFEQKKQLDYYRLQTEREFQIVEHIFNRALQGNYQAPDHIDFYLSPAAMFNGDIMLTSMGPTGNLYVMMGDFTGHGLASAIGTLPVSRAFYALTRKGLAVGEIAAEINSILLNLLPSDMFCAAAIVEMSHNGKSLTTWSGGTPDMFIVDDEKGIREVLSAQHMPLGVLGEHEFESSVTNINVSESDSLFIYSDGVTELANNEGDMFGEARLIQQLNKLKTDTIEHLVGCLQEFKGEQEQHDDISMLSLRCKPTDINRTLIEDNYSKLPHQYQLHLTAEAIKNTCPIEELVDTLASIKGVQRHKSTLFLLISEAYNNAVEHGILEMKSDVKDMQEGFIEYYDMRQSKLHNLEKGHIDIAVTYDPDEYTFIIEISDSGKGFDTSIIGLDESEDNHSFGRGNALIRELSKSVSYNETGNKVTICYQLFDRT
ncbi:fused response regulator/phosphatase [Psychrosphaera ytuae]|uniref:Fused response regulator/phosphatase n=1 Tax=Psychrosphaera ytuae TaxID=2820710 RepID=A0A975DAQ6_9GAMM|nr:fused response regulator/phosphatase [Psychrosphaera ytuae]QTH63682.1 fused response regulator/phosphatase [Psychrosphaera ytuae]